MPSSSSSQGLLNGSLSQTPLGQTQPRALQLAFALRPHRCQTLWKPWNWTLAAHQSPGRKRHGWRPYLCHLCLHATGLQRRHGLLGGRGAVEVHKAVAWNGETASLGGGGTREVGGRAFQETEESYGPRKGSGREREMKRFRVIVHVLPNPASSRPL